MKYNHDFNEEVDTLCERAFKVAGIALLCLAVIGLVSVI